MTTLATRLAEQVGDMRAAMERRVAADPDFPPFDELVRKLADASEQGKSLRDPYVLAALAAYRARRADPCESCGCVGDCRVMP